MPEMGGLHLYKEKKKIDNNLKVCFLTAGEIYCEQLSGLALPSRFMRTLFLHRIKSEGRDREGR